LLKESDREGEKRFYDTFEPEWIPEEVLNQGIFRTGVHTDRKKVELKHKELYAQQKRSHFVPPLVQQPMIPDQYIQAYPPQVQPPYGHGMVGHHYGTAFPPPHPF